MKAAPYEVDPTPGMLAPGRANCNPGVPGQAGFVPSNFLDADHQKAASQVLPDGRRWQGEDDERAYESKTFWSMNQGR